MTLEILAGLEQGTDQWHDQRRGTVTASVVGQLITAKTLKPASNDISRGLTAVLAAERITNFTEPTFMNSDMWRGVLDEPVARDLYSEHYTPVTEVGFMVRREPTWTLGYSPDGLVGDDGLIEIKSRRSKKQLQTILADAVPPENVAQLQAGLLVSGREWIDYVSFCGGMPLFVKRVLPDPQWHEAIVAALELFEDNVAEMRALYADAVVGLPLTERIEEPEMRIA